MNTRTLYRIFFVNAVLLVLAAFAAGQETTDPKTQELSRPVANQGANQPVDIRQNALMQLGLSREQVLACVADPEGAARMTRLGELATRDGVTGTPMFFLNGAKLDDPAIMTYDGMAAALDAAIAARAGG